jgi:hypothetical protein
MQMNSCKNCNELIDGNYCSNCGQSTKLKKIDRQYVINEIKDVLYTDKVMLFTIKRMLTSPGKSFKQYIAEDRSRYVKPIAFLFISSLIYTLINSFCRIEIETYYLQTEKTELPTYNLIFGWLVNNRGYAGIVAGFFMSFWIKLFFRKSGYNIYEIFLFLCFIAGIAALFLSFVSILQIVTPTHLNLIQISSAIIVMGTSNN